MQCGTMTTGLTLPAPVRPTMATLCPGATSKVRLFSTSGKSSRYRMHTFLNSSCPRAGHSCQWPVPRHAGTRRRDERIAQLETSGGVVTYLRWLQGSGLVWFRREVGIVEDPLDRSQLALHSRVKHGGMLATMAIPPYTAAAIAPPAVRPLGSPIGGC